MNLIGAVTAALGEIGIPAPASLVNNSSTDAVQVLAIATAAAMSLATEFDWNVLETQTTFNVQSQVLVGSTNTGSNLLVMSTAPTGLDTTWQVIGTGIPQDVYVVSVVGNVVTMSQVATSTNASISLTFGKTQYPLPADYSRLIPRTQYDKSRRWAMVGPATPQEWEWLKSSYISTGPRIRYRLWGGYLQTWPIIATNDLLSFEYISNAYAIDASTMLRKPAFTADSDMYIYPDRLFICAIKARYMIQRGLDSEIAIVEYKQQLDRAKAFDKSAATLSMAGRSGVVLIDLANVPDSGYGG